MKWESIEMLKRLTVAALVAVLTVCNACHASSLTAEAPEGSMVAAGDPPEQKPSEATLQILIVGLPLSPLHSVAAIGQELCLRGHNVTVASVGEDGLKKTRKYTPKCNVNYVSLGPAPLTKEEVGQAVLSSLGSTNNTFVQMRRAAKAVFQKFFGIMDDPLDELLQSGGISRPDYALLSMPIGSLKTVMIKHRIEYAIK
eukprot:scaffold490411_cov34-Prasinocladus_malaysianus.AAC.1